MSDILQNPYPVRLIENKKNYKRFMSTFDNMIFTNPSKSY